MNSPDPQAFGPVRAELISIRGADAATFANNQLASRIEQLDNHHWQWTAWLDATGRVRFLGMIWRVDEGFHLLLRGGQAEALAGAMRKYVLRARVEVAAIGKHGVAAGPGVPMFSLQHDNEDRALGLGSYSLVLAPSRAVLPSGQPPAAVPAAIAAGHPWLPDEALDALLPPALNLAGLGAVVLGKGCYPGQEVVNRLHTRGGHKYLLAHLRASQHWKTGETLRSDNRRVGTVLGSAHDDYLVVVRKDALATLDGTVQVRTFDENDA